MQSEGRLTQARRKPGKEGRDLALGALRGHGLARYRLGGRKGCLLRKHPTEEGWSAPGSLGFLVRRRLDSALKVSVPQVLAAS